MALQQVTLYDVVKHALLDYMTDGEFSRNLKEEFKKHIDHWREYDANQGPEQFYYDFMFTVKTSRIDIRLNASSIKVVFE